MSTPEHAQLPLWKDKSSEQQMDTLKKMVMDLYVYALREPMTEITSILDAHVPADEKEAHDIELIRKLMNENANLLNRNCENGHFTGSALVIDLRGHRFLLHLHKKLNRWFQFGGHPDYETDIADIALRESVEETGFNDLHFFPTTHNVKPLDIDVHIIPERKGEPEHPHLDFRYLLVTNNLDDLFDEREDESSKFKWFGFENVQDVENLVDPALYRFILKARDLVSVKR
jgi:8-oxo-dGTP pyrophosphatase MutT (NUDIX family)